MLGNIVASKAITGPLNTLDSEIIAILTFKEEFIAANAEIK